MDFQFSKKIVSVSLITLSLNIFLVVKKDMYYLLLGSLVIIFESERSGLYDTVTKSYFAPLHKYCYCKKNQRKHISSRPFPFLTWNFFILFNHMGKPLQQCFFRGRSDEGRLMT